MTVHRRAPRDCTARVSALYIYPIKSCAGVELGEVELTAGGFVDDRRYMLIDEDSRFISQRTHPALALVRPHLDEQTILLTAPSVPELSLPVELEEGTPARAVIWKDEVWVQVSEEGSAWFSEYLKQAVRLVFLPPEHLRLVNPKYAAPTDQVGLADGYPLLLTSESSLQDLNSRMEAPLPMNRFRPNVVVSGLPAFAEDTARLLRIGKMLFDMPKLCERCVVTTTDQETAERGREPLRALTQYRLWNQAVWFGANLLHRRPGILRVGDPVEITETGSHPRDAEPVR